eukprot:2797721-Pyramimonas_sp.AAC.1
MEGAPVEFPYTVPLEKVTEHCAHVTVASGKQSKAACRYTATCSTALRRRTSPLVAHLTALRHM